MTVRANFLAFVAAATLSGSAAAQSLPGAGLLPQDGQIVAGIYQPCGGEPRCLLAAWGTQEATRFRQGFGGPGRGFGPNGEIMKDVNSLLPQNLHPHVGLKNIESAIQN